MYTGFNYTGGGGSITPAQLAELDDVLKMTTDPVLSDFTTGVTFIENTVDATIFRVKNGMVVSMDDILNNKIPKLSSVTANAIAKWDSTTKELKDSVAVIDDNDNIIVNGIPLLENANNTLEVERLKSETHVFILAGQSNSIGRCAFDGGEDYPVGVMQYDRTGSIIQAVSPLDHHDETVGSMGMSVSFAIEYMKVFPNVTLIFIPQGIGGSSFGSNHWNKGDYFYEDLVSRVNTFTTANPTFKLKGMLWHQGENDATSATVANAYQNALDTGMTNFKADIPSWDNNFKVILGGIYAGWVGVNVDRLKVQGIIEDTPNRLDNFYWVSSEEPTPFGDIGDNIHYDAKSQRLFGRRYLKRYLGAIGYLTRTDNLLEGTSIDLLNIKPEEAANSSGEYYLLTDPTTALKIKTTNFQAPMVVESTGGGWAPASQAFIASGADTRGAGTYYRNSISNNNFFIGTPYQHTDDFVIAYNNSTSFSMALAQTSYSIMKINGATGNMYIGDGIENASEKLEVKGNALLNPVVGEATFEVRSAINLDARIKMRETTNGAYGTDFYYKGSTNQFAIEGINNFSSRGLHFTVERDNGNIGIGLNGIVPSAKVHIAQTVDSNGLQINGFDDKAVDYIQAYIDANGTSVMVSSKAFKNIINGSNVFYTNISGLKMYDNKYIMFGNNNNFKIKYNLTTNKMQMGVGDVDNLSIDSVGNVEVANTLTASGFLSNLPLNTTKINTLIDTPQSTTVYTGTYGQVQVSNSNQTDGNFARLDFGDGDPQASASLGAKLINHTLNYADFDLYTRGADGFKSRMKVGSDGKVIIYNDVAAASYETGAISSYNKFKLWGTSTAYTIGMKSGSTFGTLNNFATTFTMGTSTGMGWLWRTDVMGLSEGSMSLSNDGRLTVLDSIDTGGNLTVGGDLTVSGDVAWTTPTLLNGWVAFAAGYSLPRYRVVNNVLYVQGLIKSGTVDGGSIGDIFLLPTSISSRISFRHLLPTQSSNGASRIDVFADGTVRAVTGGNAYYTITLTLALD